jgi:YHS domain-containing protein
MKILTMKYLVFIFTAALFVAACNTTADKSATQEINTPDSIVMTPKPADSLSGYTAEMLDSKKDHVCGMPVSAGISDTAHFNAKVYGFCSKACKDEFVKAPLQYLSSK